jgi:hypothetical protein
MSVALIAFSYSQDDDGLAAGCRAVRLRKASRRVREISDWVVAAVPSAGVGRSADRLRRNADPAARRARRLARIVAANDRDGAVSPEPIEGPARSR